MRNYIIIIIALILVSCSDNSTDNVGGEPYGGEYIQEYIHWEVNNLVDDLIVDSTYSFLNVAKTDFKMVGDIYIGESNQDIEVTIPNQSIYANGTQYVINNEKYKLRFSTNNDSNSFEFTTDIKVSQSYDGDYFQGHFIELYIVIDSIFIDKDTLFPTSLGADSLNYAFAVPEARWYTRNQVMYDSMSSSYINEFEFLEYFFNPVFKETTVYYQNSIISNTFNIIQ
ncbi:MAG: hypothetical protein ACE364_09450 [Chlorobiota bacterium]